MLRLYQSNRAEQLGDLLGAILQDPLASPFESELIVVPHMGMARWLTLRLADANNLCANTEFLLPAGFIWRILNRLFSREAEHNPFDAKYLQWNIYRHLISLKQAGRGTDPLMHYLFHGDELDLFQLSGKIAECYDQYLVFRPDWISRWEASKTAVDGDEWQAMLWRRITAETHADHWVDLQRRLYRADEAGRLDASILPSRITLFGLSSLSPAYIRIIERLARHTELHCFLLNPCRVHWTDILSPADKLRHEQSPGSESLYLDVGHPLLASLGVQGRDFFAQLLQFDPGTIDLFSDPPERGSLLGAVQRDILDLSGGDENPPTPRQIEVSDRSLQIHSCHTPMREVEVLKDRLLDLMDADASLQADDILVMVTDMERYAPFIDLVFGVSGESPTLPFSLSGRSVAGSHPLIDTFLSLLILPGSRFDAESVVTLLEVPAIRRRFGLDDDDLSRVVHWIASSGIRWGRDASSREALGLPPTDQNSWRAGIDRLLLGLAIPESPGALFRGVLPCDSAEGSESRLLEGLIMFTETLFASVERLQRPRTLSGWSRLLGELISLFMLPEGEEEAQVQWIRELATELDSTAEIAGFQDPVSANVIHEYCTRSLENRQFDGRLFSGGITFGTMTAMRGLPFRVICLLGLDDGKFPRNPTRNGFDLMTRGFRPGDRSLRIDDRYLFLETLISARQTLYLSFVGQDVRDNESMPPSVLISELIDYLHGAFIYSDGVDIVQRLPLRHPLQPFSERYFRDKEGLFSYSHTFHKAAASSAVARRSPAPFIQTMLTPPDATWQAISIEQLRSFFRNPTRYLLRERLGISLGDGESLLENREPFELDRFENTRILERLVDAALSGTPAEAILAEERAAGSLPHGEVGHGSFTDLRRTAETLSSRVREFSLVSPEETVDIAISFGNLRLTGRLPRPAPGELAGYAVTRLSAVRQLGIWIDHLALNAASPDRPVDACWLDTEKTITFRAPDHPRELLGALLRLYYEGLSQPIHFFPYAAFDFVEKRLAGKGPESCVNSAQRRWIGSEYSFGESEDAYYGLAFPDGEVLDEAFQRLSIAVFEPLLLHREER